MLPREHRLHPRSRVRSTIRHGRRVRSGHVVLHFLPAQSSQEVTSAAVVVGKAVGSAVQRHKRQRQVRHALAQMWTDVPSGSLVVRALPGDVDFEDVVRELESAVARL